MSSLEVVVRVEAEEGRPLACETGRRLTPATRGAVAELFERALELGLDFKVRPDIYRCRLRPRQVRDLLVSELPQHSTALEELLEEFAVTLAPLCKNEASPYFLGFGDTGDDLAALAGGILALFTQQNLINQSFDSPSATFVEIAVLRWLRELLGYTNPPVRQGS